MDEEIMFINDEFISSGDAHKDVENLCALIKRMRNDEETARSQLRKVFSALRYSGRAWFHEYPVPDAAERIIGAFIAASSGK